MKINQLYAKLPLLLITVISFSFVGTDQYSEVYTPNGSGVYVFQRTEKLDPKDIEAKRLEYKKTYPKAIIIGDATNDYNCHHYAWHMSVGNSEKWWMPGGFFDRNELYYVLDGSYTQVESSDSEATHLVYFLGKKADHSAIKTNSPIYVESKWGNCFLMRHYVDDCPYSISDIRYYKLTMKIDGPTEVKGNMIAPIRYTLLNAPAGAAITWSVEPKSNLLSGQGTSSITVKPNFSLGISAQSNMKGSKVNIPSVHTICSQTFQITDINLFRYGQREYDFTLMAVCDVDAEIECVWGCDDPGVMFYDVEYPDDAAFAGGVGRFTAVRFPSDGTYNISVYANAVGDPSMGISHVFTKPISVSRTMRVEPPFVME